ncbi:MAG: glycosyltransferase family 4 protein [Oscillatoriales cyanobacterium SM2_2_1]|nr:glycosyltransferase family 4 protein [Oscillatoriales cyanobacterium SM2_2_1]
MESQNRGNSPKKISIITQFFPPDFAATGQFIYELSVSLAESGFEVAVFTGMPGYAFRRGSVPRQEEQGNLMIRRTGATRLISKRIRSKLLTSLLFVLRGLVKFRHPALRGQHLVITSAPPFLGVLGWFYHKFWGQTYSCIVYDVYPDVAVRLKVVQEHHALVRLWHFVNRKVWQRAQSLIVLSEPMRDLLISRDPSLKDKIYVISSWANPDLLQPLPKQKNWFVQQQGWGDRFVVMYSGNLGRCHDEDTLIACAQLLQAHPQVLFSFIGDGVGCRVVESAIINRKLVNAVRLPYQEQEVLPFSLAAADISVVSMRPNVEGVIAPSKVYGMLAVGRPIVAICPPHSYLRQLIREGNCGACFDNGDAAGMAEYVLTLFQDQQLREALGQNARRYFEERFTLEQIVPQYLQALGLSSEPSFLVC